MNIEKNLITNSDILLVSFGGLGLKLGISIPEFKKVISPLNVNKIFVTDENRSWYYKTMKDLIYELKKIISDINPKNTIFFGYCAGGYAAILYGLIFEVDRVITFNGQTFLSKKSRKKYNDNRWGNDIVNAQKYADEDYLDLWNHDKKCKTVIEMFYSENPNNSESEVNWPGQIHAELFYEKTKYLNVVLHSNNKFSQDHIAHNLRKSGELLTIFQERIGG